MSQHRKYNRQLKAALSAKTASYHGIVFKFVHEIGSLRSLVEVKPNRALELITAIQEQYVWLGLAELGYFSVPPRHAAETRVFGTFPGVPTGLFHSCMDIVGVQQRKVPRGNSYEALAGEQDDQKGAAPPLPHPQRPHDLLVHVRLQRICNAAH